jgi:uncharacterized protein YbjT (DUF2867 family)
LPKAKLSRFLCFIITVLTIKNMTAQKFTILGATGNIGTQLVHQLLAAGHHVTAVARPSARLEALAAAGATTKSGDLNDAAFVADTLRGADAAFLMIPPVMTSNSVLADQTKTGEAIAQAVRDSGLKRAVHLSSIGADQPSGTGPVVIVHQQEARLNAIEGLQVTHLRPAYFMENLLANIGMIQHLGITGSATQPDVAFPMVATKDIAARAFQALTSNAPAGVQYLLGPRNYSLPEAAAAIGQALGRPELPYVPFSYDDAQQGMVQAGLTPDMAGLYLEMTRHINEGGVMATQPRSADSTTPTTLEDFTREVFAPAYQAATAPQHA